PARPAAEPAPAVPAPVAEPRLTPDIVRARLSRCFKQAQTAQSAGVQIDPISTTLRIKINAEGIGTGKFDRPMKPELVMCAGSALVGRFAEGLDHVDVS